MVGSGPAHDRGSERNGAGGNELTPEQRWRKLWAFGISPKGLALPDEQFWELSWAEYHELRALWAEDRALFFNANFSPEDKVPYSTDDFLYPGSRERRKTQAQMDAMAVRRLNAELETMTAADLDGVPDWAKPRVN